MYTTLVRWMDFGRIGSPICSRVVIGAVIWIMGLGDHADGVSVESTIGFADSSVASADSSPSFSLSLDSDRNDFLGQGRQKLFTDRNSTLMALHESGYLSIEITTNDSDIFWMLEFLAPRGSELLPGIYEEAIGPSPRKPAMRIRGEHRSCGGLARFVIREAEYGSMGEVNRLAIDFENHCGIAEAGLFGSLRIGSDEPIPGPRTPTATPRPDQFKIDIEVPGFPGAEWPFVGSFHYDAVRDHVEVQSFYYPSRVERRHVSFYITDVRRRLGWTIVFAPPLCGPGSEFGPGLYEEATGFPSAEREDYWSPVFNAHFEGWGPERSDDSNGQFFVHEARIGKYGEVYRLAADFVQCHGHTYPPGTCATPWVIGSVDYTSTRPTPTPAPPTPTPSDLSSIAMLRSDCGDYIGSAKSRYLTLADGDFSAFYDHGGGQVTITFLGDEFWHFNFSAPAGQVLTPGVYEDFDREYHPDDPWLRIGGAGRGCNDVGRFEILEIELGKNGEVLRFAVDFEQHCQEFRGPGLHGAVRYRSTLPPPPAPMRPCWGDCNGNGAVDIGDLIFGVNIVLHYNYIWECELFDHDEDGVIRVDDLVYAVKNALDGC